METPYIASIDFRNSVNEWLKDRSSRSAARVDNNKLQLPQQFRSYTKTLYLAAVVDDNFIDKVNFSRGRMNDFTLWTKEHSIARSMSRMQTIRQGEYKILVSKTIAPRDLVFDFDEFITFMGIPQLGILGFGEQHLKQLKEQRAVLVTNTLSISRSEYTILQQSNSNTIT